MKRKPLFVLIPISILFASGGIVMLLWNWLMPDIFGLRVLNYWQSLELLALSRMLFGGFGFGRHRNRSFGKSRFREKWSSMSEVEKQHFRERWDAHCMHKKEKE